MVNLNINIQKKDLWLLSAVVVFLIGVGFVVANGATPKWQIHGHPADEIEGGLQFYIEYNLLEDSLIGSTNTPMLIFATAEIVPSPPNLDYTYTIDIKNGAAVLGKISFADSGDVDGGYSGRKTKTVVMRISNVGDFDLNYTISESDLGVSLEGLKLLIYKEQF